MENKVLVTVYVPSLDQKYDMYIPVNKRIYAIIDLIKLALFELSEANFRIDKNYELYNHDNGELYDMNKLVRDTNIKNNSNIMLI